MAEQTSAARPRRRTSLRTRVLAWSFVPTAVILLAVATVILAAYQQVTEDLVVDRNRELTRLTAGQILTELSGYVDLLEGLASSRELKQGAIDRKGDFLLEASNQLVVFDRGVELLDNHGRVVAVVPAQPQLIGEDRSGLSFFREVLRTIAPDFSDVIGEPSAGPAAIYVSVPILSDAGEFRGVLVGKFNLGATAFNSFYGGIVKLRVGNGKTTYLIDGKGIVIYHSDALRINESFRGRPVVEQALKGQVGDLRSEQSAGQQVLATFAPVPSTPWVLVQEEDWSRLLESNQGYGRFLFLLLALGVLAPAVVVWFGLKRVLDPVSRLIAGAKEVAAGNLGHQIHAQTGDKLEDLVAQFNAMSSQLLESYSAVKGREERLALVMRATDDGIWDWDLKTNEVYFSPRWKSMLGYSEEEVTDSFEAWRALVHPEDVQRALGELEAYQEGRSPSYQLEHRLRHKDGSYRWVLTRGVALRDPEGRPYRMVGSHDDITQRKRAEEALQESYQMLERRVEERTRELALLNEITSVVSRTLDLKTIIAAALDRILASMNMQVGVGYRVRRPDCERDVGPFLDLVAERGLSDTLRRLVDPLPLDGTYIQGAAQSGEPAVWRVDEYPVPVLREGLKNEGFELGISVPLRAQEKLVGAIVIASNRTRTVKPEELSLLAAMGQQIGVAISNAHLFESEHERRSEAERRRRVAEALRGILTILNSDRPLEEILGHITDQASEVLGSDAIGIFRLDREQDILSIQASRGLEAEYIAQMVIPSGEGPLGEAVTKRRPVLVPDRLSDTDEEGACEEDIRWLEILRRSASRLRSAFVVPLVIKDESYGAIALYYKSRSGFSQEEIDLAVTFADQAALAIENARLRDRAEENAALAERTRLARELHDSVTQSLYSVTLYAEAAARLLTAGKGPEAASHLRELRDTAQEALREMRLLIFQLRPPALEKSGLAGALQARMDAVESRLGVQAEMRLEGPDLASRVPFSVQQELYYVAHEALNNVLRHARAAHVIVGLKFEEATVWLRVEDDGIGFDPQTAVQGGGLGLDGMLERAKRVGGELTMESQLGSGTRIAIRVPLIMPQVEAER